MSEVKINPLMISAGPSGVTDLERLQATCNGLDAQNDALALENGALREQLDAQRMRADTADGALEVANRTLAMFADDLQVAEQRIAELESGAGERDGMRP